MNILKKLYRFSTKLQKYFFVNVIALCGYVIFTIYMYLSVFLFKGHAYSLDAQGAGIGFIVVTFSYFLLLLGLLVLIFIEHLFKILFVKQQNNMSMNSVSVYSVVFFIGMLINICYIVFILLYILFVFVLSMF